MSEDEIRKRWRKAPMLTPRIRKVTVNISVGQSGEPLEKAGRILEQLTGQKPAKRKARKTIRDFGIRKGEPISCVVTLRRANASKFLSTVLQVLDNKIPRESFDENGNFSFGIDEHIEIPGTRYQPELGIFGMDVSVALGRAGHRVKVRRRAKTKLGRTQRLTPEEAAVFLKDEMGVETT